MKAALGGVAAAAVWSAPRIEGLSVAPDVAQAASCTGGTATVPTTPPFVSAPGHHGPSARFCWGVDPIGRERLHEPEPGR